MTRCRKLGRDSNTSPLHHFYFFFLHKNFVCSYINYIGTLHHLALKKIHIYLHYMFLQIYIVYYKYIDGIENLESKAIEILFKFVVEYRFAK